MGRYILGTKPKGHDSNLAIVNADTGELIYAVALERHSRKKHDPGDIRPAIDKALAYLKIDRKEIIAVGLPINPPDCLRAGGDANTCGSSRAVVLAPVNPALEVAARRPMFHSLDLTNAFCTVDVCPGVVGNIIVYKDWHHVSATFIRSMIDELGKQMDLPGAVRKSSE